ncbi:MAG: lasso peptide biosynthesis B2 protein [Comamonadaceae bacterium]|jgi:hypothetical protein|nr:lasso peptide biosynthesis B2 protein [Comamonadaceae bacterium]
MDYRLADHVRACHVDGQVILLDLHRDKYIGAGGALLPALSGRISGWPAPGGDACLAANESKVEQWLTAMGSQGLVCPVSSSPPIASSSAEPSRSLFAGDLSIRDGMQWRRITQIACATLVVGHWLKRHRLSAIVERIVRLRASSPAATEPARPDRLESAAAWYLRTRPMMSTAHEQCLRDSLTLIRFLASEHLYPQWVIGVRTRPFAAHSWVQEGDLVLNDLHETVRRYKPILVV